MLPVKRIRASADGTSHPLRHLRADHDALHDLPQVGPPLKRRGLGCVLQQRREAAPYDRRWQCLDLSVDVVQLALQRSGSVRLSASGIAVRPERLKLALGRPSPTSTPGVRPLMFV